MNAIARSRHSIGRFFPSARVSALATIFHVGLAAGLMSFSQSGLAAQATACPMAILGDPTGNVCTASDINIATAVVGQGQGDDFCVPGDTVEVEVEADFTIRNQTRYDPGIWIAKDGLPLDESIADGGAVDCEVLPVQGQHHSVSSPMGAFEIDSFDASEDICNDTNGDQNNAVINNVPITFPGGPTYDDPITLDCVAGPTGLLVLQALVSWNQSNPGVCDPTMPSTYDLDLTSKCSYDGPIELDIDVVGRVTVIKNAPGGGMTDFEFAWTRDNAPQFAMVDPGNPFTLQDGQSQVILGEIGTTGAAEIVITEQSLPVGWTLTNISCINDDLQPVTVDLGMGEVTVPLVYNAEDPGSSQSDVICTFTNNQGTPDVNIIKDGMINNGGDGVVDEGDTISYTFDVTNTGTLTLTNLAVTDPLIPVIDCGGVTMPPQIASLAAGVTTQCTGSYSITQADIDAGLVMNTASVTAECDDGCPVNDDDTNTETIPQTPAIDIVKAGVLDDGGDGADPGDIITYTFDVTNTGNQTLSNVTVTDPLPGLSAITCPAPGNGSLTLNPDDMVQCTATYMITQADIDAGMVDNIATVVGDCTSQSQCANDADPESVSIPQNPGIDIVKNGALDLGGDGVANPGDVINYTFDITNTGNVTLTMVSVTDPLPGLSAISCPGGNPIPTLAPNAMVQCTATYAIDLDDINAGVVNNLALVQGECMIEGCPVSDEDPHSEQIPQTPALEVVKSADPQEYSEVGEIITYTFEVTNTGNLTLFNIDVSDPLITDPPNSGSITCPGGNPIPSLAPGASVACTGLYAITADDLLNGQVANVATVTGECITIERGEICASDEDDEIIDFVPPATTFRVTKDFSDDNPAGVTVSIECNTGLPLQQSGVVHDPDAVGLGPGDFTVIEFIVGDFEPGTMDCDIEEEIPAGYEPTYTAGATTGIAVDIFDDADGCHYEDISFGTFTCDIFNELQPVDVVVEKQWIDENPEFQSPTWVEITLECDGPIVGGYGCIGEGNGGQYCIQQYIDPANPGEFEVFPHFEGTTCRATEELMVGVLTDESDCEEMIVFPGQGDSCVIVNTRLYAGIPTLNQYSLILLALLMLGVGAVAYRRFA